MQQHITVEQLQELTEEQRAKLWEWWKPAPGDRYCSENGITFTLTEWEGSFTKASHGERYYMLLSIGQCIELLIDSKYFENNYTYCDDVLGLVHCNGPGVDFAIGWRDSTNGVEFTDALWQAVKKAL